MEVTMDFGTRLALLRKKYNLTQSELSKKTGISRSAIASYEATGKKPPMDRAIVLSDFFKVSTDYLLGKTSNPTFQNDGDTTRFNYFLDEYEIELITIVKKLPTHEKIKLIGRAEKILEDINNSDDFRDPNIVESMISQKNVG